MKWFQKGTKQKKEPEVFHTVVEGLKNVYRNKLLPLEEAYRFHDFHSAPLDDPDFEAKPMILLIGQYSTGKTTFIRYLLEQDFPGIRIGPEPTTDRFIAVMGSDQEGVVPGSVAIADPTKPFKSLAAFGNSFSNSFQCSQIQNPVLDSITIVDTPGILSGEKQRLDRGYEFDQVMKWFAERADRIIILFDAYQLDFSDEFRRAIEAIKGHDEKIRIVLNKADMVDHQQFMRVYGALMWSLSKVLNTPENARVFVGSFWDQPLRCETNRRLFELEEQDLFADLQSLSRNSLMRKLNDLIKRSQLAKVHAHIISQLRKEMPSTFGKSSKKRDLINKLPALFAQLQREHQMSPADFPDCKRMQDQLMHHDFARFSQLKPKLIETVDDMLATDIADLLQMIPIENAQENHNADSTDSGSLRGGAFVKSTDQTPFSIGSGEGIQAGEGEAGWIVDLDKHKYDKVFQSLGPIDGKISGTIAKNEMVKSKLPNGVLAKIWRLADYGRDGDLDEYEWALACHLIKIKLEGNDLPSQLPVHLIPPNTRKETT